MLTVTTPAVTSDLTILATLKTELQILDTAQDAYLADLIRQASDAIARFCCRTTFGREDLLQTERLGWGASVIILDRDINPAIITVTEAGTLLDAAEWELDGSMLYRLCDDARWHWAHGKTVIAYSAGYNTLADLPHDLERACLEVCKAWWFARDRDPMLRSEAQEDIGSASYIANVEMGGLPPQVEAMLAPYRVILV